MDLEDQLNDKTSSKDVLYDAVGQTILTGTILTLASLVTYAFGRDFLQDIYSYQDSSLISGNVRSTILNGVIMTGAGIASLRLAYELTKDGLKPIFQHYFSNEEF